MFYPALVSSIISPAVVADLVMVAVVVDDLAVELDLATDVDLTVVDTALETVEDLDATEELFILLLELASLT